MSKAKTPATSILGFIIAPRGLSLNPKHCAQGMATSRKIALLFGAENINAIIGWIALLFVARKMGAEAIGEFSYAVSLVGGFTFLAFFGFRMAHVKRVSEGLDLGKCIDKESTNGYLWQKHEDLHAQSQIDQSDIFSLKEVDFCN